MNQGICNIFNNDGFVRCFLTDKQGNPLDPTLGAILCQESLAPRENVYVTLSTGEHVPLQKVNLVKQGYVVIEIGDSTVNCSSEPIPFRSTETIILCAPEGTELRCHVTDFNCNVTINCENGNFTSLDILIMVCQEIKTIFDTVIEIPAHYCNPRNIIEVFPYQLNPPNSIFQLNNDEIDTQVSNTGKEMHCLDQIDLQEQIGTTCISVPKVYDWTSYKQTIPLHIDANDIRFNCTPCNIDLFVPAVIICEGTLSGTVHCGTIPINNTQVSFNAAPNIVTFNPEPTLTDTNGNFVTTATVPMGTPSTPVTITATTSINGQILSMSLVTIVQCSGETCTIELFTQETITCNSFLDGRVFCGNTVIEGAIVQLNSNPNILTFEPNPTVTGSNGNYFAGITIPPGTPSQPVTITASTIINGQVLSAATDVLVECPSQQCTLTLSVPPTINCNDLITGHISCGGVPVQGASISFDTFPDVVTFSPNPAISDVNGDFTTTITVPPGTPLLSVLITATTTVNGQTATTSAGTQLECQPTLCTIELFSQDTISCNGSLQGSVFCGSTAIEGAVVQLTSNPNILTFEPNPTITGSHGNYFAGIIVPPGTPSQTVTITASTIINGQVLSAATDVLVECPSLQCTLTLSVPPTINCNDLISGHISCGGIPVPGVSISFDAFPGVVTFSPNPAISDVNGDFTTTITVPPGTPLLSVLITATTTVNGQTVTTSVGTQVECQPTSCTIELFSQDPISCNGSLQGSVFCGSTAIEGAVVQLTSNPNILTFEPNPTITGSHGNYFAGITVPPGTPSQTVTITASTIINGQILSTSTDVLVECPSSQCTLTLSVPPTINCNDLISGHISCGGAPVPGANISFDAFPGVVTFSPNPAISDANGNFTTTITVPPGTPLLSVLITATTTVNGQTVTTSVGTQLECQPTLCTIELFAQDPISCNDSLQGSVFCGSMAIEGAVVQLTSNPNILTFDPNPTLTGSHGNYFAGITVPPGTPSQTVTISASTIINGQLLSTSTDVLVECPSSQCTLTLSVPPTINCNNLISGHISCGGAPVPGANISFDAFPGVVTFSPNPAISDVNGDFTTTITVPPGTPLLSVLITATTTVNGQTVTTSVGTQLECQPTLCTIELFAQDTISCNGSLQGSVFCGSTAIEGAVVQLTSNPNILTFDPNPALTGSHGNYFAGITVPPGTPSQLVTISASTIVNGQLLSTSTDVLVECPNPQCTLTLSVPPTINCNGLITGNISCGGIPIPGASISFDAFPSVVTFSPNPATSGINGDFQATVTVPLDTPLLSINIAATTTVNGQTVTVNVGTQVECPLPECPCKFRLGISGNRAPAKVNITDGGVPSTLTGNINVTSVQCFIAGPGCNPTIDNFTITFGSGGTSINFIQGRRIDILCGDHNFARVHGTAVASGLFNGIFEVTIDVSINPINIGTWTIFATDHMGNTFSTTFTAEMGATTFIGDCGETT